MGRFFAVDPLVAKYPYYSSYQFGGNRVLDAIELEGLGPYKLNDTEKKPFFWSFDDYLNVTLVLDNSKPELKTSPPAEFNVTELLRTYFSSHDYVADVLKVVMSVILDLPDLPDVKLELDNGIESEKNAKPYNSSPGIGNGHIVNSETNNSIKKRSKTYYHRFFGWENWTYV